MGLEMGNELLKEWYLGQIEECKEYIQLDKQWIATLNGFREKYQHNWKIVEVCRELVFHHIKSIQGETKEIGNLKKTIKRIG